jgi:hypothetical protein
MLSLSLDTRPSVLVDCDTGLDLGIISTLDLLLDSSNSLVGISLVFEH